MRHLYYLALSFWTGVREFRLSMTTAYPEDQDQADAYDWGRELAHRVTFRRFEP